jgi:hypothetical protein
MGAWDLGKHLPWDEQTIGFQGIYQDKQRISYKKEGDGSHAGYYQSLSAPRNIWRKSDCWCTPESLSFLTSFCAKIILFGLDNPCISAQFSREALNRKNKVMVHKVCRKEGHA